MEKLCKIRDVQRAIMAFEQQFSNDYGISLNEGMLLCSLAKSEPLSSKELGQLLGLTSSNISKVIASAEKKRLIIRTMGNEDKRQMYFSLEQDGKQIIKSIKCSEFVLPSILEELTK